jgi:transcription elongation factor GreA
VLSCALQSGIVGPAETAPAESRICPERPVGRALLGHHAGDVVHVQTPDGRDVLRSEEITSAQ